MARVITNLDLTAAQKTVLTKIAVATTPKVAAQQISKGRKMVEARDLLIKLGLIDFMPTGATLTQKGQDMLVDEGLADESGTLTPEGEKFAYVDKQENPPTDKAPETSPMESLDLFKQINTLANLKSR